MSASSENNRSMSFPIFWKNNSASPYIVSGTIELEYRFIYASFNQLFRGTICFSLMCHTFLFFMSCWNFSITFFKSPTFNNSYWRAYRIPGILWETTFASTSLHLLFGRYYVSSINLFHKFYYTLVQKKKRKRHLLCALQNQQGT